MKHRLQTSADESWFIITTTGDGDVKGIIAFLDDIVTHPQWRAGKNILLDHRNLMLEKIQLAGIEEVSNYFKSISPKLGNGKIALVMNRDIDFGIARSWENMTGNDVAIRIKVFREMEKAMNWLKE